MKQNIESFSCVNDFQRHSSQSSSMLLLKFIESENILYLSAFRCETQWFRQLICCQQSGCQQSLSRLIKHVDQTKPKISKQIATKSNQTQLLLIWYEKHSDNSIVNDKNLYNKRFKWNSKETTNHLVVSVSIITKMAWKKKAVQGFWRRRCHGFGNEASNH